VRIETHRSAGAACPGFAARGDGAPALRTLVPPVMRQWRIRRSAVIIRRGRVVDTLFMTTRWWTRGVWATVAASAVFWGVTLLEPAPPLSRAMQTPATGRAAGLDQLDRLLGADTLPPAPAEAPAPLAGAHFQLLGVVSPSDDRAAAEGLALVAVDGRPARAFRVGAAVDGEVVLQAVGARSARLGPRDGAAAVVLSLAPPQPAATGSALGSRDAEDDGVAAPTRGSATGMRPVPAPRTSPRPQPMAPAQRDGFRSPEQLFHERQQLQFQQEQLQNQGPDPTYPSPSPKGDTPLNTTSMR